MAQYKNNIDGTRHGLSTMTTAAFASAYTFVA